MLDIDLIETYRGYNIRIIEQPGVGIFQPGNKLCQYIAPNKIMARAWIDSRLGPEPIRPPRAGLTLKERLMQAKG